MHGFFTIVLIVIATAFSALPAAAQWNPSRNIEIITPAAGSAMDNMSRLLQRVMQEKKLTTSTITIANRPGAGNALGFNYLASHSGDAHLVASAMNFAGAKKEIRTQAPEPGAHTDEVLQWLGYSQDEITRMRASGAVAPPGSA